MVVRLEDDAGVRRNSAGKVVRAPTQAARVAAAGRNQVNNASAQQMLQANGRNAQGRWNVPYTAAMSAARAINSGRIPAVTAPTMAPRQNSGGGGGGGGGGYGGGGGGANTAALQAQMDFLAGLLGGTNWKAEPLTGMRDANQQLRGRITTGEREDLGTRDVAYNNLDQYLAANNRNPYNDVRLTAAQRAPSQNAWLTSQGVGGLNDPANNPEDVGYGTMQNILSLLGANYTAGQQSLGTESQLGRLFTGQEIGGRANAYLANVDTRDAEIAKLEAERQANLDQEKRSALLQLAQLIGQGAKAPDLAALGLA